MNVALPYVLQVMTRLRLNNASRVLTLVGLEAKRNDYPAQLSWTETTCGIARALVSQPEILLCDEANLNWTLKVPPIFCPY
jgi:D-methionine transport system ATP-binding protein